LGSMTTSTGEPIPPPSPISISLVL
jgi:hypothetical protein